VAVSAPADSKWTASAIRDLGVRTNMPTACSILGISASSGYGLAARGQFPVNVLRVGNRMVVPVAGLLDLFGIDQKEPAEVA
jgi:hypothetical protein